MSIAIGAAVGSTYNGRHDATHNAFPLPLHPAGTGGTSGGSSTCSSGPFRQWRKASSCGHGAVAR